MKVVACDSASGFSTGARGKNLNHHIPIGVALGPVPCEALGVELDEDFQTALVTVEALGICGDAPCPIP